MKYYVTISIIFDSVVIRRFANEKGQCHREGAPAIETNDGDAFYYIEDELVDDSYVLGFNSIFNPNNYSET
jgi:hypothetical protein